MKERNIIIFMAYLRKGNKKPVEAQKRKVSGRRKERKGKSTATCEKKRNTTKRPDPILKITTCSWHLDFTSGAGFVVIHDEYLELMRPPRVEPPFETALGPTGTGWRVAGTS